MATKPTVVPIFVVEDTPIVEAKPIKDLPQSAATLVLVADQHTDVVNSLRETLSATDYALLYATDGKQAIALLEKLNSEIRLAIIELELPGPNGFDLIALLTYKDPKPMKIIAITSRYNASFVGQIKELGADAVLLRPIAPQEWVETVKAVLSA